MGPSGAGKSSLFNLIGMPDSTAEGKYCFAGRDVNALIEKESASLYQCNFGLIYQSYHLNDELIAYENLETPLLNKKIKSYERISMICDMLDRFQIVCKKDLFPSRLSGGQQQIVGVARTIINRSQILLADEPTGNLHSGQGEEITDIFKKPDSNDTIIIQVSPSERNAPAANAE